MKCEVRFQIRSIKRILADSLDRTSEKTISFCDPERFIPVESYALWYEEFTSHLPTSH